MAFKTVLLLASAVVVGMFVGAVGIGGVLLIPALMIFAGLTVHQAAATALFTFLFTGIMGTWLFTRRGTIDWRTSLNQRGEWLAARSRHVLDWYSTAIPLDAAILHSRSKHHETWRIFAGYEDGTIFGNSPRGDSLIGFNGQAEA